MLGLLDTALPEELRRKISDILEPAHTDRGCASTRSAPARPAPALHRFPRPGAGNWTVQRGHDLLERMEEQVREAVPNSTVFTHLEPIEDPVSWEDTHLERKPNGEPAPDVTPPAA